MAAAGGATNVLASLLNKPRRQRVDIGGIMQGQREGAFADLNQANANMGLQLSGNLASHGLNNSGIGGNILARYASQASAPVMAGLSRTRSGLLAQQDQLNRQYQQEKRQYIPNALSQFASTLGTAAGGMESNRQSQKYLDLLQQLYGVKKKKPGEEGYVPEQSDQSYGANAFNPNVMSWPAMGGN
jgi:hypothetical protein